MRAKSAPWEDIAEQKFFADELGLLARWAKDNWRTDKEPEGLDFVEIERPLSKRARRVVSVTLFCPLGGGLPFKFLVKRGYSDWELTGEKKVWL